MKGSVAVLVCDGVLDSSGETVRKDGVEVPDGNVPVALEFGRSFADLVGSAKLRWVGNVLFADLELLDTRMKENAAKILYPCFDGACFEKKGSVIHKSAVRAVGLSVGKNADERIGTLWNQGVR